MHCQKLRINKFLPNIFFILLIAQIPDVWAATLIYQHSNTQYSISVFKSEAPTFYTEHSITLDSITGDQAIFIYNGSSYLVTCNGNWHDLNQAPGTEIQNTISCLPDTEIYIGTNSKIDVQIRLFDQNVYKTENIHLMAPEYNDPTLKDTSIVSPWSISDDKYTATACKWAIQNLGNDLLDTRGVPTGYWVVYAKTDVIDLSFTIDVPPQYPYSESNIICSADLNTDGDISENEVAICFNVEDKYLCPLGAINCTGGTPVCPLGDYACILNSDGVPQCSPYSCSAFNPDIFTDEDTEEGENDKTDNGPVDEDGGCLGTLYIFSGNDKRCRMPGISTQFKNCCKNQYSSFLFSMDICNGKEVQLTQLKEKGLCHYVGSYCSKKIPLVGCVQKKKTYCCFHSKLSRIINEQGRTQLQSFGSDGGWGTPKSPGCRGFTIDEFQILNFSLIDLSEWYGDITTRSVQEVQDSMQQKMDRFYE